MRNTKIKILEIIMIISLLLFPSSIYASDKDSNEIEIPLKVVASKSTNKYIKNAHAQVKLSCYGRNGIAYGKAEVKLLSGERLNGKISLYLYSKTTNGFWEKQSEKKNVKIINKYKQTIKISKNITNTRYWKVKIKGYVFDTTMKHEATSGLINKKGEKYPEKKEPYSNKKPEKPSTNLKSKLTPRDKTFRSRYIKWFKKKYPKAEIDWSDYEIHHVIPLEYGGSNKISNGIALKTENHKLYTKWWKNY